MSDSAEIILGYIFTQQELVDSSSLRLLTLDSLRRFLRRRTKHLDLEGYSNKWKLNENINLRTGFPVGNKKKAINFILGMKDF